MNTSMFAIVNRNLQRYESTSDNLLICGKTPDDVIKMYSEWEGNNHFVVVENKISHFSNNRSDLYITKVSFEDYSFMVNNPIYEWPKPKINNFSVSK